MRLFFLAIFVLLLSCTSQERKPLPKSTHRAGEAAQSMSKVVLTGYDSATRVWELATEHMITQSSKDAALILSPVKLDMYNAQGKVVSHVVSDSGSAASTMDSFFIWGNVHIKNSDGSRIIAQSLSWSQKARRLTSKEMVTIMTSSGERLSGVGFDAAEDFSEWYFFSEIQGEFNNAEDQFGF